MKEEDNVHYIYERKLRDLWMKYGAENDISFKDFKLWLDTEASKWMKEIDNE